jgi:hypothetical protein
VDKVDFILRKLHENKPIYPVALVPQGPRLQCSEALGFAHFHPSDISLPRVVGGRTDIMRRTHRLYRASGLRLLQYPNDLFLAESTPLDLLLFL